MTTLLQIYCCLLLKQFKLVEVTANERSSLFTHSVLRFNNGHTKIVLKQTAANTE